MFKNLLRTRTLFLAIGFFLAAIISWLTDPDGGFSTVLGGIGLLQVVIAIALAHFSRKKLFDYPGTDMEQLVNTARHDAVGAGLLFVGICIVFVGLLLAFAPRAHAAVLPAGFFQYGNVLKQEQLRYWPDHPDVAFLAALVEQESCVSLKSKKCWNPSATLKSQREEGAGMGQITRAYRKDGSTRFDSLTAMRTQYRQALGDLTWHNVYQRPELQLRAMVLMSRDAARPFSNSPQLAQLAFGDAAYNGGIAGVQRERRACKMAKMCDPDQWFGNVELHCLKSRQALYGGRNACDINREHVRNVMLVRAGKYRQFFKNQVSS